MRARILDRLKQIETEHSVKILYACESGSRAWGFASQDSDYDVRFVYVRPRDWYLAVDLERRRDVIELPIDDALDINGWDLRKALKLFHKSNPPLLEWLNSPTVYRQTPGFCEALNDLLPQYYSPSACAYHYLHMARGNFREYLQGDSVRLKKYLYVLRPLLAVLWIEQQRGQAPTLFQALVDAVATETGLRAAIDGLLATKRGGLETAWGPSIPALGDFIERELNRLRYANFKSDGASASWQPLNELFRAYAVAD